MPSSNIIIAIDGHSSSGKSSFARAIATKLGYLYIDTGAMYRAVTLFALRNGIIDDEGNIDNKKLIVRLSDIKIDFRYDVAKNNVIYLNGENVEREIRQMNVSANVSNISAIAEVRKMLVQHQQAMGIGANIVMDGRDIGTVVFPDADLKIFLTASIEVRACRRYEELCIKGYSPIYADIEKNIRERDNIDEHRQIAPLHPAIDAIILDNSTMTPQEQMEWVMQKINKIIN